MRRVVRGIGEQAVTSVGKEGKEGKEPYLVVVAPKGDFDIEKLAVFIAQPHQGVNYHRGTWHHYCLALNCVSDFLVVDRIANDGVSENNCDVIELDGSLVINF